METATMASTFKLLSYKDLKAVKGIPFSRRHLLSLEFQGQFPKRISVGVRLVAWVESEIDAYIAARMANRDKSDEFVTDQRSKGKVRAKRIGVATPSRKK